MDIKYSLVKSEALHRINHSVSESINKRDKQASNRAYPLSKTYQLDHTYSKFYVQGNIHSCKTSPSDILSIDNVNKVQDSEQSAIARLSSTADRVDNDKSEIFQKNDYQDELFPAMKDLRNNVVNLFSNDWDLPERSQDFLSFDQVEYSAFNHSNDTGGTTDNYEYPIDTLDVHQNTSITMPKDDIFFSVFDKLSEKKEWFDTHKTIVNNIPVAVMNIKDESKVCRLIGSKKKRTVRGSECTENIFLCKLCYNIYSTNSNLVRHMKINHKISKKSFDCSICSASFLCFSMLESHTNKVHKKIDASDSNDCGENDNGLTEWKYDLNKKNNLLNNKLTCLICKKVLGSVWSLNRHNIRFHCAVKIKCVICGKSYKNQFSLSLHIRNMHLLAASK